jgi:hypothetical protein
MYQIHILLLNACLVMLVSGPLVVFERSRSELSLALGLRQQPNGRTLVNSQHTSVSFLGYLHTLFPQPSPPLIENKSRPRRYQTPDTT